MKKKIIHIVTVHNSINLMKGQLNFLKEKGYDVIVVSSPGENLDSVHSTENVRGKAIFIDRTIAPFKDVVSLVKLIMFFIKEKPDIVNAGTPKAGLLGMIAAWLTRVPFKVYTNRGMPFERNNGIKRGILKLTEKISCALSDRVICISPSIRDVLLENNLTTPEKTVVFGNGSSNGLDLTRFKYTEKIAKDIEDIKNKYELHDKFVIGNVGRINNFKGITELVTTFEELQANHTDIVLLLVGRIEEKDSIDLEIKDKIFNNPNIIFVGFQSNPIPYYYIFDVFAFPTYMEGFGNTSIEAQAVGTPAVVANVTGAKDTIVDGETGILIEPKDTESLKQALTKLINDRELANSMGKKGKERVYKYFSNSVIWNEMLELYQENI